MHEFSSTHSLTNWDIVNIIMELESQWDMHGFISVNTEDVFPLYFFIFAYFWIFLAKCSTFSGMHLAYDFSQLSSLRPASIASFQIVFEIILFANWVLSERFLKK